MKDHFQPFRLTSLVMFALFASAANAYDKDGSYAYEYSGADYFYDIQEAILEMKPYDTDRDGTLSSSEIDAAATSRISSADSNSDDQIDSTEFTTLWQNHNQAYIVDEFQELDGDGNLSISLEELQLTYDELQYWFYMMPPAYHEHTEKKEYELAVNSFDNDNNGEVTDTEISESAQNEFTALDLDANGQVTLSEFSQVWLTDNTEWQQEVFDELDTGNDGLINHTEISADLTELVTLIDEIKSDDY